MESGVTLMTSISTGVAMVVREVMNSDQGWCCLEERVLYRHVSSGVGGLFMSAHWLRHSRVLGATVHSSCS